MPLLALAGLLAGCSQAIETPLPELGKITRPLLTAEQQKKAIEDLTATREARRAEAIKTIEQEKAGDGGNEVQGQPLTTRAD
jgi:hypothetical protein